MSENRKKTKAKTITGKSTPAKKTTGARKKATPKEDLGAKPLLAYEETLASNVTRNRRNVSTTIQRTDKYKNIDDGLVPFKYATSYSKNGIEIRDAVILCQKAYYNFSTFRNVIDLMTEFSVNDIYFKGGNKKARDFFEAFFKRINIWGLQDKFFREYYRSGNVFVYRFDADLLPEDAQKISQVFGLKEGLAADKVKVPSNYILLNPADIQMTGSLSFHNVSYSKTLSDWELQKLRNPQTDADQDVFDNLSPEVKKAIKSKKTGVVLLPLDMDKVTAVFYKKQDYEPFGVPMGYPVLEDINFKAELKKMDMAIARTMQQAILLVTMGNEPDKGGINQKNLEAMQELFTNQSVGRVLIADYTTKAEFVVPRIADLLDPKKYETFDKDINLGLNNILVGNEKFANQESRVKVFIARLEQGRQAFLNDFLIPEIKKLAKSLNFRSFPTPYFQEIALSDNVLRDKIYTRLFELGALTPEETFTAIKTRRLPDSQESLESQKRHKEEGIKKGLYESVLNKKNDDSGRPNGSKGVPQSTQNIAPVGAPKDSQAVDLYNTSKIKENMLLAQKLENAVQASLRKKHGIKRLNKQQKEVAGQIADIIVSNEKPEDWNSKIEEYCENPTDKNKKRTEEVQRVACEHQIDMYLAALLVASKEEKGKS
tara:strand:+ start:12090 stop:14057 length:1968 start_codon:yes stop_codon:yes gene_type:complete